MKRKKIIKLSKVGIEYLMSSHKCCRATVYNALAYRSNNATAEIIRQQALKWYGGVETHEYVFD